MSKDKFVFEWRAGDRYKVQGNETVWNCVNPEDLGGYLYKPHGKAKKRYKAEKTAWNQSRKAEKLAQQQSKMKVGDWVKDIVTGERYQLEMVAKRSGAFGHEEMPCLKNLKPCKPPKPESISANLTIEIKDNKLIFNGFSIGQVIGGCTLMFGTDEGWIAVNADELREIADLLEPQA